MNAKSCNILLYLVKWVKKKVKRDKFNLIASGEIAQSSYYYQIGEINKRWVVRIAKDNDMIRLFQYNELITNSKPPPPPEGLIGWFYSQTKAIRLNLTLAQLQETINIVNSEAIQKTFMLRENVTEKKDTKRIIFH